jgi:hypothetical protein
MLTIPVFRLYIHITLITQLGNKQLMQSVAKIRSNAAQCTGDQTGRPTNMYERCDWTRVVSKTAATDCDSVLPRRLRVSLSSPYKVDCVIASTCYSCAFHANCFVKSHWRYACAYIYFSCSKTLKRQSCHGLGLVILRPHFFITAALSTPLILWRKKILTACLLMSDLLIMILR